MRHRCLAAVCCSVFVATGFDLQKASVAKRYAAATEAMVVDAAIPADVEMALVGLRVVLVFYLAASLPVAAPIATVAADCLIACANYATVPMTKPTEIYLG